MALISYANTVSGSDQEDRRRHRRGRAGHLLPERQAQLLRICPADDIQGGAAANWAYGEHGPQARPTSFTTTAYYGKGVAAGLQASVQGARRQVARLRGLRSEGVRLPVADDRRSPTRVRTCSMSARPSTTTPARCCRTCAGSCGDEVIFLGPDGLINAGVRSGRRRRRRGAYLTFAGYHAGQTARARRTRRRLRHPRSPRCSVTLRTPTPSTPTRPRSS